MPSVIDDAVCLRHWEWSETSQTAALFTREHGIVRVIAKGSRRPNARFSGGIEALTLAQAGFIPKQGDGLSLLTSWDLLRSHSGLRRSLPAIRGGLYAADLLYHAVTDRDPHRALFDALLDCLGRLAEGSPVEAVLTRFQLEALDETGYRIDPDHDVQTGGSLADQPVFEFIPMLGGFSATAPEASDAHVSWKVRRETVEALKSEGPPADPAITRACRLLAAYWRELLGREIPSMRAAFGDLAVDSNSSNQGPTGSGRR